MNAAIQQIELVKLLADLEEDAVLERVRRRVEAGDDPLGIIEECNAGMRQVGERYEQGQSCHGFTVIDLGVDVPPDEFAKQVSEQRPDIVGLSGVQSSSYETMRETVNLLRTRAQQDGWSFPIIIGGGMIDDQICRYVGADHWVADAMSGVHLCQELMGDRPSG